MKRVLVTGGGGFLGQAIVRQLLAKGYQPVAFNRKSYPELTKLGVPCIQGDIVNKRDLIEAARDCAAIIHTAAKAGVWGPKSEYQAINVQGTQNVIKACRHHGISKLVYTSSPSVVFHADHQKGVDESVSYPDRYLAAYPESKAAAEQLVLAANSKELATVSLRPHLIWGPGDPHLTPRIIERAKAGRLRLVGDGEQLVDTVYVDNAAQAHICALEKLSLHSDCPIAGRSYFITNQEPWPLKRMIAGILQAAGINQPIKTIPYFLGYQLGGIMEFTYKLLRLKKEPLLTRFVARQLALAHWYDPRRAKEELGYIPNVSMKQGMARLRQHFLNQAQVVEPGLTSSKLDQQTETIPI